MVDVSKLKEIGLSAKLIDVVLKLETQPDEVLELLTEIELNSNMLKSIIDLQSDVSFFLECLTDISDMLVEQVGEGGESAHEGNKEISPEMEALYMLKYFKDFVNAMCIEKDRIEKVEVFSEKINKYVRKGG